jgi:hypothetical protein
MVGFIYSIMKDFINAVRLKGAEDIVTANNDLSHLRENGHLPASPNDEAYAWVHPKKLYARTGKATGDLDIVQVPIAYRKRARVVRLNSSGNVDSVLCVKRNR